MLKLTAIVLACSTVAANAADYGFVVRPHKGYWQVACYAIDTVPPSKVIRSFLTTPWQGRFATRQLAETYARDNVDCDY